MKHILQLRGRKRWLPAAALLVGLLPAASVAQAQTFNYSATARTYVVPTGVSQLQVTATGGSGGRYNSNTDYVRGAVVAATITVLPGETLTINTGGQGAGTSATATTNAGGTNGGGSGSGYAGGGGGATDVRRATAKGATTDYLTSRNALLVAAGGGGSDLNALGGAAGTPAGGNGVLDAAATGGQVGGGATQTAPGGTGANSGTNGTGGNGNNGGGGGGGYYGGGGGVPGNSSASGGGGSSWVSPTALVGTVGYSLAGTASGGQVVFVIPPPTITSVTPTPGGLGQLITVTGTNLGGVTSLTVNGVTATVTAGSNTATSLTFRVPATATASGTIALTGTYGTASTDFTLMPAPGNALNFDGTNDYVTIPSLVQSSFTIEYWLRTSMASPIGQNWYNGIGLVDGETGGDNNDFGTALLNNHLAFGVGNHDVTIQSTTAINDGLWHHVAVTRSATTGNMQLYIDGVLEASGNNPNKANLTMPTRLVLGSLQTLMNGYLNGSMDELRFYNTVLTQDNIQADRVSASISIAVSGNLVAYYNFDAGTPGGTNTGLTSLYDQSTTPTNTGTLNGFALTGATSNWVESYAMVVPTATAATSTTATGLTANWTAPVTGTVTGYLIDVSTTADFSAPVSGSPFSAATGTGSQAITGLAPSTTYYYRVRADKTSVTGQGSPSNTIMVTTPSNVATLSNLVLSAGSLSPAFSAGTTSYTLSVPGTTTSTTVTPTITQANATVTVNGTAVASGAASGSIALAPGANTISVVVTAQDGTTQKTYTVTVTRTCTIQAIAQNVSATLNSSGTATVTTTQLNNNSTGTCGPLTYTMRRVVSATVGEGGSITLTAPAGMTFSAVTFASYGTPTANANGTYSINTSCHASTSQSIAEAALLGKNSGTIVANNATFTDPCNGTVKTLVVQATYTAAAAQTIYTCTDIGSTKVLLTATDAGGNTSSAVATVTITDSQVPTAVAQNVTVMPGSTGTITVTAAQVNNGSSDNCALTLGLSQSTFSCTDIVPSAATNPALAFNGTTQYAEGTSTALPLGNATRTIEAWVYPTAASANGVVFNYGTPTNNLRSGLLLSNGKLYYVGENNDLAGTIALTVNAWNHVAATYDGTTLRLYVNGVADATKTVTTAFNTTGSIWRIARRSAPDNSEYLTGRVDEVRVWTRALTAAEVTTSAGRVNPTSLVGLIARWDMREGSGTSLADQTGNSAAGTLYNTPTWTTPGVAYQGVMTTLTATDASGNVARAQATVTIVDNLAPTAVAQNVTVYLASNGAVTPTAAQVNNGTSDNCSFTVELLSGVEKVANGTFDTDVSNWTATNIDNNGGYRSGIGNPGGAYILNSNGTASIDPTLTQTISGLTVGATYVLRGNYRNYYGSNTVGTLAFAVDLNGSQQVALPNPGTTWTPFTVRFTATATSQTLGFRGEINGTDIDIAIDNISLRQLNPSYTCANLGANPVLLLATDASGNEATATATVTVSVPALTTTTWNGSTSTDWNDCRNWSYGQVPSATISAVIDGTSTVSPTISSGTAAVNNISITNTSGLTLASGATLQVNGNWTSTSTAGSLAGTVAFVSSATQTVSQPAARTFGTVVVNKASGTVQLSQSAAIGTALTMTNGTLTTGSYQVALGATATITESETSYVVGNVAITRNLVAGTAESFNGLGLTLAPAAGSVAPGSTLVIRTTGTFLTGIGTSQSVQRYFDIRPTTNTGLNVTMTFGYFTHELNGIPEANLRLFKSTTTTSGPWTYMGVSSAGTKSVTRQFLTDFSIWTLGNSANPLPVQLVDFTAQAQGTAVALAWHTATETNSDHFEVERSVDGASFAKLATVAAHGTTTAAQAYAYRDAQLPSGVTTLYYRLRQVDLDGTATYSPVRTVAVGPAGLALFPNPAATKATLTGAAPSTAVLVFDALGRVVLTTTTDATGTAQLAWPAGLPSGVYIVRAGQQATRLTVE